MDLQLIIGPLVRQLVQWASGAALGVGVMTDSDVTAAAGAIGSLVNLGFVIYARTKAGK